MPLELQPVVEGVTEPVGPVEQGEHAEGEQDDAGERVAPHGQQAGEFSAPTQPSGYSTPNSSSRIGMSSTASRPRAPNSAHRNGSVLIERGGVSFKMTASVGRTPPPARRTEEHLISQSPERTILRFGR